MSGDADHFSLRWNNFHKNLSSGFQDLLQGELLVDVTLAAGGQFLQAHKMVLSICSPYFKELFKVNPCQHPIVILKDVGHKELEAILQFMYQGEANVRQEELGAFLKTAEMLQIKGLAGDDSDPSDSPPEMKPQLDEPEPPVNKADQPSPRHAKRMRTEAAPVPLKAVPKTLPPPPPAISATAVPPPTLPAQPSAKDIPSPSTSASVSRDDSDSRMEFVEVSQPKSEPIEYDSDIEEVDDSAALSDDPLVNLLVGEGSQSHSGSSPVQGVYVNMPGLSKDSISGLFAGPSLSQDSTIGETGGQGRSVSWKPDTANLCPVCRRNFSSKYNLKVHMTDKHSSHPKSFVCTLCKRAFKNNSCLRVHKYQRHRPMEALDSNPSFSGREVNFKS